ncbi:putative bifunctional diguanylate cyclase/phosphodiesterase [Sporosarcina aquimarina]|uniref:GGDEF and EAL domain-containing protein n=1 Tax=Sporosarcina aquimarina TaxID=114975 RepID=A0ABU4G1C4_9BACL|nr:GGDEF and EAL domain-containing protein [Sporosarcina aquimarina]MDW0110769.1 GGDEF and EAL domain-containing protein [Sporosarcina aquimarina]
MHRDQKELAEFISKMQELQQDIFKQAKQLELTKDSMHEVSYELCKSIAELMKTDRVSIWLFNHNQTVLTEHMTYATDSVSVPETKQLDAIHSEGYFDLIVGHRVNPVVDIATHPALQALHQTYFAQSHMVSLIDASIIMSRGIGGMLCCESVTRREWTKLDEVMISAIADMLSFIFDRLYRLEMEDRMLELAYTDLLTGIDNENAFIEKVNERLHTFGRGMHGAFLYIKIDQFTAVQSVLGPGATEMILKEIAQRFHKLFPVGSNLARIAFDHFIICTEHEGDNEANERRMAAIMEELRSPIVFDNQDVFLTFSYGVALYPDHIKNAYEGIQAAKTALDSSQKITVRKTRAVYNPDMYEQWKEAMQSEMNLGKGLDMNEFRLYYQPQVESITHVMTGAEALIRWQHPEKGLLSPASFIEIAETTGLISQIGEWALHEACKQLKSWEEQGLGHLTISVNISPRHFLYHRFEDFLQDCLKLHGVNPANLILEITENVALEDAKLVEAQIQRIRQLGFTLSIDDFGTGYSAFIYLQQFSIQEIKIDRQFIKNIETDVKSRAIVRAILTLAKSLHMHTVAEGVETEGQLKRLEELGCFEIQGYYFSRPIPIEELNKLLLASPEFPFLHLPAPIS